ncbi:unnamed protein product [Caenorhabditis brenneri]
MLLVANSRECNFNVLANITNYCPIYSHELDEIVGEDWDAVDRIYWNEADKISKICDRVMNSSLRNQSYIDGKSCILEIAKNHCSEKANTWLQANYDGKFLNAITIISFDYDSLYHELLGRQCEPECIKTRGVKFAAKCRDLKKNLSAKREAFKSGESCFLDIVEENCMDSSIHYLNHNYAQFLEFLTVPPKNQNCISLHDYLMGAQCIPLKSELVGIGRKMKLTGKLGDSVEDLRNKCREARDCMIGSRQLLESLGEVENMCAEM